MKIIIFIIFAGIAAVVFYLFLRKAFDQPFDEIREGRMKLKSNHLPEETGKDQVNGQNFSKKDESPLHMAKIENNCCQIDSCQQCDDQGKTSNQ